jgi:hypothetical protein
MTIPNRFLTAFSKDEISILAVFFSIVPTEDESPAIRETERSLKKEMKHALRFVNRFEQGSTERLSLQLQRAC